MPWDKSKSGDAWQVTNTDTGEVKGTHGSEPEADAQLAALYANADPEAEKSTELVPPIPQEEEAPEDLEACKTTVVPPPPAAKAAPGEEFRLFIPITKIDEERREVWGWGAKEEPDATDEIMDYESSKPHFIEWSAGAQKRSGGKSKGNVRTMHQANAAGKLVAFETVDAQKGFWMGTKVVDDAEWRKVLEGVYTGYSVGGSYLRRWPDRSQPGLMRYTAKPIEMSLVDAPCVGSATFQVVKGINIQHRPFTGGDGTHKLLIDLDLEKQAARQR